MSPAAPPAPARPDVAEVPPPDPVPPHEQAIAGAAPLGAFPFGMPGSADWAGLESAAAEKADEPADHVAPQAAASPAAESRADEPVSGGSHAAKDESPFPPRHVTGLFGENLVIRLHQVVDPADDIVTETGLRLDPGERAVLVRTEVVNNSPIDHASLPDQFLALMTSDGRILTKAPFSLPDHPVHRVGIRAGERSDGWTLFLVPATALVRTVRWDLRPDLTAHTQHWEL